MVLLPSVQPTLKSSWKGRVAVGIYSYWLWRTICNSHLLKKAHSYGMCRYGRRHAATVCAVTEGGTQLRYVPLPFWFVPCIRCREVSVSQFCYPIVLLHLPLLVHVLDFLLQRGGEALWQFFDWFFSVHIDLAMGIVSDRMWFVVVFQSPWWSFILICLENAICIRT